MSCVSGNINFNQYEPMYRPPSPPQSIDRRESNGASPENDSTHPIACITCSTRKVKCDRQDPSCSNCIRSNIQCEYRAPLPRGPRKRKYPPEEDLHARLERYEELLRGLGIPNPADAVVGKELPLRDCQPGFRRAPRTDGRIVTSEQGKPRYIENKLWDAVAESIPPDDYETSEEPTPNSSEGFTPSTQAGQTPQNVLDSTSLLGGYDFSRQDKPFIDPKTQYLTPEQTTAMLEIFCANVHPVTKMVHMPTLSKKAEAAVADPTSSSRKFDAVLFSLLFLTTITMTTDECLETLGQDRTLLLDQLQDTTCRALMMADMLRSDDIEVLQAFTMYLLAMRERLDLRTMWMLTGTALRMAMGVGLHRGGAFESHFTPFETEYRRRVWWQVAVLDTRVGELAGFGASPIAIDSDAKSPANYNDADISPEMTEFPPPRVGGSEMMFILARAAFRDHGRSKGLGPVFMGLSQLSMKLSEREKRIREMEAMFEQKVLRYCDPLEPVHVLTSAMARGVILRLRLKAYHPMHNIEANGEKLSDKEKEVCWQSALRALEYDTHCYGSPSLQGFLWHLRAHFQWDALIYVLVELKRRGNDAETRKGWKQVEAIFRNHPELVEETRRPLHLAVTALCLKAWNAKEAAQLEAGLPLPRVPAFVEKIRENQAKKRTPSPSMPVQVPNMPPPSLVNQPDFADFANASLDPSFFDGFNMGVGQMDWSLWNDTMQYHDPQSQGFSWNT